MTVILQSNAKSVNNIGNIHGYSGPADYVAMLDFNRDIYKVGSVNRQSISLSEAVTVIRPTAAPFVRQDGTIGSVGNNIPRISYSSDDLLSGLVVNAARTNLAASASSQSVTIPAASATNRVMISYKGGSADLSAAELTLEDTYVANGRVNKKYIRSTSSSFSASLSTSSGAAEVMVCDSASADYTGDFSGYSSVVAQETVSLAPAIVGLLSGGSGTVLFRHLHHAYGATTAVQLLNMVAVKSAAPHGGIFATNTYPRASNGTHTVITAPD